MERKHLTKEQTEDFAKKAISDAEQELWENGELGTDLQHAKKSAVYKSPSKQISLRVPNELLEKLKEKAESEGLRYQTYIISLLKRNVL